MVRSLFSKLGVPRSITPIVAVAGITVLMIGLMLGAAGCGGTGSETTNAAPTTEAASTDTTDTSEAVVGIDPGLIGKWHSAQTSETLEFTSDGKMIITPDDKSLAANEFSYTVEGANVVYGLAGVTFTSAYSIDGDILTIVNPDVGGPVTCERVK